MPSKLVARTSAYFVLLLAGAAWFAAPALADDQGKPSPLRLVMPDVKGKDADRGIEQLEQQGLDVLVLTIAGPRPGVINSQDPQAGTPLDAGDEVVVYVGIAPLIQTIVPDVRGRDEQDIGPLLDEAYVLDVEYVTGMAAFEGKVVRQSPRPDARLPYRGRFRIEVVRRPVRVPNLVGKFLREVESLMADSELALDVRFVRESRAQRGLVLSQTPRAGSSLMPRERIRIDVAGPRDLGVPDDDSDYIVAPDVVGMSLYEAQADAIRAGFVPHIGFVPGATRPEMVVASQQEQPGSRHPYGAHLHFSVWKRDLPADRIQVPSLFGIDATEAAAMIENIGLRVEIQRVASALAEGTVVEQSPDFGVHVDVDSIVRISVASVLPDGANVEVEVPDVRGMDLVQARAVIVRRGLRARLVGRFAPNRPVGLIYAQDPAPGSSVAGGERVKLFIPKTTIMPNLMSRTVEEAEDLLTDAGLRGRGRGPALGAGTSRVVSQAVPAGASIARGSAVEFRYAFEPAAAAFVVVPDVRGKGLGAARQALAQKGLTLTYVTTSPLRVGYVVATQTPVAGSRLARGSKVRVTFGPPASGRFVTMPNTIGQSRDASVRQLTNLGLSVRLVGRAVRGVGLRVIRQSVTAGTRIARGSTVTLTLGR